MAGAARISKIPAKRFRNQLKENAMKRIVMLAFLGAAINAAVIPVAHADGGDWGGGVDGCVKPRIFAAVWG